MTGMRSIAVSIAAVSATLMLVAPAALAGGDASDLAGRLEKWEKAFNAGEKDALAALYTEDAARLAYQAPTVNGRAGIAANIQAAYDLGVVSIDLGLTAAETQGTMAWGQGTYTLKDAEGAVVASGKWLNVSKKVGGAWLIHRDIWNTDAPE
jgi:ketosteroid isomerase-like protein